MSSRKGIKIKREDFKSLKDEIKNIKGNINEEMYSAGVFMNEKEEYVWRANQKKIYEKSSPEKKYDLNEILKYYELNNDKYIQGFTNNYFRKLTDLMSKNKYKKYTRERLDLFNSRINKSQKIYINYLKKNGKDSDIKSSINKKIKTPFVTTIYSYNSKMYKNKNENKKIKKNNFLYNNYIQNQKSFLSSNISTFSNNEYDKKIVKIKVNNKYDSTEFSNWKKDLNNSKANNKNKNKNLTKYFSYKNMLKINNRRNSKEIENNFSFSYNNKNKLNTSENNLMDGKNEFIRDLDKDKYHDYLRSQYQFFDDYYMDKNKITFELKTKRRKNLFNLKPNGKFLEKIIKNVKKSDFFNKIKRNIKNETSPVIKISNSNKKIIYKNKDKGLPSLSARFIKTMKFNSDCNLIYEKVKKTLV